MVDSIIVKETSISDGDDEVRKRIIDRTKLEYTSHEIQFANLFTSNARKEIVRIGNEYLRPPGVLPRSQYHTNE